jgi:hypothetical protein
VVQKSQKLPGSRAARDLPQGRHVKTQALRIVLWTGSVGLFAMVVRRLFRRLQKELNVGNVSEDWLAQQRGSGDTTPW